VGLAVLIAFVAVIGSPRRHAVDRQARHLRVGPQHRRYTDRRETAATSDVGAGPLIGPAVNSGKQIRASWEDMAVIIAGARMGKTTAHVVPTILDAPGAVYATSNKSDVVALTAALRARNGSRVWVFDPQDIAGGDPSWWWNPLDIAHDVAGARRLAGIFSSATRPVGARHDAFFHPESEELLASLLLAGACARRSLVDVYGWINRQSEEPVALLEEADFSLAAQGLDGVLHSPDRHRAPVFATAKQMLRWVADPGLATWVIDDGTGRRRFDADAFADTTDTVYSLSCEGADGAGPLTAALTAAVVDSALCVARQVTSS
jgi:type IV secretory pathway TraG/TraD family ATPase VirD4